MLGTLLPQAACGAGWHRIEPVAPQSLPERQQIELWQGSHRLQLHAVKLLKDSISGVPYVKPPECDSCRVSMPTSSVDSLRAGNPTGGFWKTAGLVVAGMLVLTVIGCATTDSACDTD
jgi:hypothetical protein